MKIAVGLSGGVDSAVTALLLRDQGHEVVGVHLYCWPPRSEIDKGQLTIENYEQARRDWIRRNGCRADEDEQMALKTALELGIKFVKLDFSEEYNKRVVDYFYAEYEAGRTPNPDVLCNSEIKFGLFLDWTLKNNFDYIATGHYAKLCHGDTVSRLCIPKDKHKDQTYFLWKLTEKELKHVLFPLGDYLKSEVREIALRNNLTVAKRKDSQGICFIGNVEAREFLARRLKKKIGKVLDKTGRVIGEHDGIWFYTIGQRGGWRMDPKFQREISQRHGDTVSSNGETPVYYVISKDAEKNELVVGVGEEAKSDSFSVTEINWLTLPHPDPLLIKERELLVRIRHGGELIKGQLRMENGQLKAMLDKSIRGIAPGQSAVFYKKLTLKNGELTNEEVEMVGGGVIA